MSWWQAYVLTLLVEVPIVVGVLGLARIAGRGRPLGWVGAVAVAWALNLTHPVLWWARPQGTALYAAEALVALVEGAALWLVVRRREQGTAAVCLLACGVANAASLLTGLLVSL